MDTNTVILIYHVFIKYIDKFESFDQIEFCKIKYLEFICPSIVYLKWKIIYKQKTNFQNIYYCIIIEKVT